MKVLLSALFLSLAHSAFGATDFPTTIFPTSDSPTIDETETSFPTSDVPSGAPCLDSTRPFVITLGDMTRKNVNCAWVAYEPSVRCLKGNGSVATHCQATCGKCGVCNDARKQFETVSKGMHTCVWVGAKGDGKRCKEVGDKYTCRETCGTCNTGSPCLDSTQKFLSNGKPRKCGWVAAKPSTKCNRPFVASHCPVTCGVCDEGCKDSEARVFIDGLGQYKTCRWVSAVDADVENPEGVARHRCGLIGKDGGLSTCPATCGFCTD